MLGKRVLLKKKEVTGEWKKISHFGTCDLYCLFSKFYMGERRQNSEMGWECGTLGKERCI